MRNYTPTKQRTSGFTLIELLTVIAIIAILAGILIPTTGIAMDKVRVAQSQAFFNQIATAIEAWKNEYGYYPTFGGEIEDAGANDSRFVLDTSTETNELIMALASRTYAGEALTAAQAASFNPKRRQFITFAQSNFALDATTGNPGNTLADAFGNTNIIIVMDKNKDGILGSDAFTTDAENIEGVTAFDPDDDSNNLVTANIYGGVAIYSAGNGDGVVTW